MCPPDYFTVQYAINPWMNPDDPVDLDLAGSSGGSSRQPIPPGSHGADYRPRPGLPDMVFAANGATVIDGKVLGASFKFAERHPEASPTWTGSGARATR